MIEKVTYIFKQSYKKQENDLVLEERMISKHTHFFDSQEERMRATLMRPPDKNVTIQQNRKNEKLSDLPDGIQDYLYSTNEIMFEFEMSEDQAVFLDRFTDLFTVDMSADVL